MDERQELRSLKRGLKALALLNQMEVISISELARKLQLPRTTAERILTTLASEGYVHRIEDDKRYRLSLKVCSLARGFSDESWITHVAGPLMFDLTRAIGWPVAIATPAGMNMSVRLTTDPATSLWLTRRRIGSEIPMMNSSSGLVYLAYAPDGERRHLIELLREGDEGQPPMSLSESNDLERQFERIRNDAYSFQPNLTSSSREDSIAIPIVIDGSVKAVLLMMFMTRAMRRSTIISDYLPRLRDLADTIATQADSQEHIAGAMPHAKPTPFVALAAE